MNLIGDVDWSGELDDQKVHNGLLLQVWVMVEQLAGK